MQYVLGVLLFVVGSFIGLRFADFDHSFRWLPLLDHRSLLTHSFLVPLLVFWVLRKQTDPASRLFVMGICIASAVHLGFDLFARSWYGYALIHLPFYGRASPLFSQTWILVSLVVCLYLACRLLRNVGELGLALAGLITAYGVSAAAQPRPSLFALLTLVCAAPAAFLLARPFYKDSDPASSVRRLLERP